MHRGRFARIHSRPIDIARAEELGEIVRLVRRCQRAKVFAQRLQILALVAAEGSLPMPARGAIDDERRRARRVAPGRAVRRRLVSELAHEAGHEVAIALDAGVPCVPIAVIGVVRIAVHRAGVRAVGPVRTRRIDLGDDARQQLEPVVAAPRPVGAELRLPSVIPYP